MLVCSPSPGSLHWPRQAVGREKVAVPGILCLPCPPCQHSHPCLQLQAGTWLLCPPPQPRGVPVAWGELGHLPRVRHVSQHRGESAGVSDHPALRLASWVPGAPRLHPGCRSQGHVEAHRQSLPWGKPGGATSTKLVAKGQLPTSRWRVRTWDRLGTHAGGTARAHVAGA